jgi:hypothetical protein
MLQFYQKFMHNFNTVLNILFDKNYTQVFVDRYEELGRPENV